MSLARHCIPFDPDCSLCNPQPALPEDPINFLIECALANDYEYHSSRPDLTKVLEKAVEQIKELKEKAWRYEELQH